MQVVVRAGGPASPKLAILLDPAIGYLATPAVALGGRMRTWEDTVRCNGDGVQAKALVWGATAQSRQCQAVSSGNGSTYRDTVA